VPDASDITRLVEAASAGNARAADELLSAVYRELKQLAIAMRRRENAGLTIQASDLVHEAYLRVLGNDDQGWNGRAHFFGAAAEAMRRILIEQARRKAAIKHGGDRTRVPLAESEIAVREDETDLLDLDVALDRFDREDPTKATLVKLRHFTGMTIAQAADAIGISHATADRYWAYSRARLYQLMTERAP
jgi:RNA polymerase sigma factor (TIGR02999 family)